MYCSLTLPTPCPTYKNDCDLPYYSGRLADDIKAIWQDRSDEEGRKWWFYSPDPAWELAHNLPPDMCNYFETDPYSIPFSGDTDTSLRTTGNPSGLYFGDTCGFGRWDLMNNTVRLDADTAGTIGLVNKEYEWFAGWNLFVSFDWSC